MRLAVYHDQPSGGARRALAGFCRELSGRHRLDLFTLETADRSLPVEVNGSVSRLPFRPRPALRGGLYLNDLRRRQDLRDLDAVNRQAAQLIDSGGYDAVLVDACRFTYAPLLLRHLRSRSLYYCHHGPWRVDDPALRPPLSGYERARRLWHLEQRRERMLARLDRELVGRASALATNSAHSARRIREEYGREARVCPPGVELRPAAAGEAGGHLLSVGALEAHKGFDLLVAAVARLPRAARPPLHVVANEANPRVRRDLEASAERLGVDLRIAVAISEAELEREYLGAVAFLYAAHREPLGLAPLEAMAHGLAVLAVAEGGPAESVQDGLTGLLAPRDPQVFADSLGRLLEDRALRRRLGAGAREEIRGRWGWKARAAALEAALEQVAARPAAEVAV